MFEDPFEEYARGWSVDALRKKRLNRERGVWNVAEDWMLNATLLRSYFDLKCLRLCADPVRRDAVAEEAWRGFISWVPRYLPKYMRGDIERAELVDEYFVELRSVPDGNDAN